MLAIATIGMGVRLASALASGFLVCIVTDIKTNDADAKWLENLSGPYAGTLAAYAAQDSNCHNQVDEKCLLQKYSPKYIKLLFLVASAKV